MMDRSPDRPPMGGIEVESFGRSGRFGDLWRGRAPDGREVSLKLMKPELFKDGEAIRRFQREVRLLLAFEHPGLLRVLDHGTTASGDPYLVLESVEGQILSDVVARGPLPFDRVRTIGAQIAAVLAAAASRGIVHRGLSPDAILLHGEDRVKVLDFGLAVVVGGFVEEGLEAALGEGLAAAPRLTEHGQRIGDPVYMAPEYIDAFQFDARSDCYALGIVLYELATGDPPFRGRAQEILDAHVVRAPPAPSERMAGIAPWFDALMAALLAKDPAARPTATAAAQGLAEGRWPIQ